MPKSRNRKKHKKKVNAFKNKIKERENAFRKSYQEMMMARQQEELNAKLSESGEKTDVINIDEIDIDTDDMKID